MFSPREKVVYPGHGVAEISRVIEKQFGNNVTQFFELKFLDSDMTVLVPVANLTSVGIRKVSSNKIIDELFKMLSAPDASIKAATSCNNSCGSNWGKRYKKYQGKIKTGDPLKIGDIYRDLNFLATRKELSFGEKSLLQKIEHLLAQEISIVTSINEQQAIAELRSQCKMIKQSSVQTA